MINLDLFRIYQQHRSNVNAAFLYSQLAVNKDMNNELIIRIRFDVQEIMC